MELLKGEMACDYSAKFQSVIGYGHAFEAGKMRRDNMTNILMGQYVKQNLPFQYRPNELIRRFIKLLLKMTGKKRLTRPSADCNKTSDILYHVDNPQYHLRVSKKLLELLTASRVLGYKYHQL